MAKKQLRKMLKKILKNQQKRRHHHGLIDHSEKAKKLGKQKLALQRMKAKLAMKMKKKME